MDDTIVCATAVTPPDLEFRSICCLQDKLVAALAIVAKTSIHSFKT